MRMTYCFQMAFSVLTILCLLQIAGCTGWQFRSEDCSKNFSLSNGTETVMVSDYEWTIGWDCKVDFYIDEEDYVIVWGLTAGGGYIDNSIVSVLFYAVDGASEELIANYTRENSGDMAYTANKGLQKLSVSRLRVVLNGAHTSDWGVYFKVQSQYNGSDDYPIATALGVFALALGCTVIVGLLLTCIVWCCCCRTNETVEEVAARRRRRMIDQLAKEGYSVTRDYGSMASNAPLIRNDGGVPDVFGNPDAQLPLPGAHRVAANRNPGVAHHSHGAANYDPPPAYDTVRGERAALLSRPAPRVNQPPHAAILEPRPVAAPIPEAILVEIETETAPTPTANRPPQQDLIVFEQQPARPPIVDLLTSSSREDTTPPAFGAAN